MAAKSIENANPFEFGRAMRAHSIVDHEEELRRLGFTGRCLAKKALSAVIGTSGRLLLSKAVND
jgi:hypothetical protein